MHCLHEVSTDMLHCPLAVPDAQQMGDASCQSSATSHFSLLAPWEPIPMANEAEYTNQLLIR